MKNEQLMRCTKEAARVCAVGKNNLGHVIMWTASEPDCVTKLDNCNNLLIGIKTLLEFALDQQWTEDIEIHMSDLYTYNVLTRYKNKWKDQDWHTSRNKPISSSVKTALLDIDRLTSLLGGDGANTVSGAVVYHNVSPAFRSADKALKHLYSLL